MPNWTEICEDPTLDNLPYKIQTDRWGNLLMSPATNEHGIYQAQLIVLLARHLRDEGTIIAECSVQTPLGIRVADVAWASEAFMDRNRGRNPFPEAPEICVEIRSPSNTDDEMRHKRALYFARGALECWICDQGRLEFHDPAGPLDGSRLVSGFPDRLASPFLTAAASPNASR